MFCGCLSSRFWIFCSLHTRHRQSDHVDSKTLLWFLSFIYETSRMWVIYIEWSIKLSFILIPIPLFSSHSCELNSDVGPKRETLLCFSDISSSSRAAVQTAKILFLHDNNRRTAGYIRRYCCDSHFFFRLPFCASKARKPSSLSRESRFLLHFVFMWLL